MQQRLLEQDDLRAKGYGYLYEAYPMTQGKDFYERFFDGGKMNTGWVEDTDFEPNYIKDDGRNGAKIVPREER